MKIDRLISIIMILLERKKVRLAELAGIFNVTPRTIQRDLDAINLAGVPIVSYPGVGGGVGIMENYKLEKRLFSTRDITALLMGLGSIQTSLSGDEVVGALAKVKGMIPEEQRAAIELRAGQVTIDTTPWTGMHGYGNLIASVQSALDDRRLLRFQYTDRMMNKTERTVEPYRLVLKGMRWYLDGYCLEREDYRMFKLARMGEVEILTTAYTPRDYSSGPTVEPNFQDNVSIATLRVKEAALDRLLDMVRKSDIETENGDTWVMHVPIPANEHGYKFLLGLGVDCQCLAPLELRDGFKQYLKRMTALYD